MSHPSVSVVMAVRNGAPFIGQALRSALGQTVPPVECIVVDGGSTDGTVEVVETVGHRSVRVLPQRTSGPAAARNEGIVAATGALIAFLDCDDVWHPTKLERQLERLRALPDLGLIGCGYAVLTEDLREITRIPASHQHLGPWLRLEGNGFAATSTALVPRRVLHEVGGFDVGLPYAGDLDLVLRIADRYSIDVVDEVLVGYRSHARQQHHDAGAFERDAGLIIDRRVPRGGLRRRALANLYTRLAYHHVEHRRWLAALRCIPRIAPRSDRLVRLPAEALRRRRQPARRLQADHPWSTYGR